MYVYIFLHSLALRKKENVLLLCSLGCNWPGRASEEGRKHVGEVMKIHCVLCNTNGLAGWLQSCFDKWLVVLFVLTKRPGFHKTSIFVLLGVASCLRCAYFSTTFRDTLTLRA